MFSKKSSDISICIPVCGTEKYLGDCLESIASQDFDGIEIIIVDDSPTKSEGALKIVKRFKKNHKKQKLSVRLIAHRKNKGLVEARRTALYETKGEYIMFVDSDDSLPANAVKSLFEAAKKSGADIVHGKANICVKDSTTQNIQSLKNRIDDMSKKAGKNYSGELLNRQIFDGFLIKENHSGFLWGKIFKRELCLDAFNIIPPVYCIFGEDFLTYFFLSYFAKKYIGIENNVYNYFINTGISSNKKIDSLEEWQKVCSTASVFTILLSWADEAAEHSPLDEDEIKKIREVCRWYVTNNLAQLERSVAPELQEKALKMLCDFWGEKMITKMKAQ